jgi:hypothetical protein
MTDPLINIDLDIGMRFFNGFALVGADMVVGAAEVNHDRAGGLLGSDLADTAGVVADAAVGLHAMDLAARGREPTGKAAVAKADDAGWFASAPGVVEGGGDVEQRDIGIELGIELLEGALQISFAVSELNIWLEAIKESGRDGDEALIRIPVGDSADRLVYS